jgi:hypothetical protein
LIIPILPGSRVAAVQSLGAGARIAASADVITWPEGTSAVVELEDISELSARASRDGLAALTSRQVLVWLLAFSAPVVQLALPPQAQTVVTNEYATLGIAIAITLLIVGNRKR